MEAVERVTFLSQGFRLQLQPGLSKTLSNHGESEETAVER